MKFLTIIKDNGITGIEYGMLEVPDKKIRNRRERKVAKEYTQANIRSRMKAIVERQKHK